MTFVDASAIVAILTREADADELANALDTARASITSPIAVYEAALGVCRKRHASVAEAQEDVLEFLVIAGVHIVSITDRETDAALGAFSRYGKGHGHPAQLNLGDCFAYAAAKTYRTALLFKGEDFDKTDIRSQRKRAKYNLCHARHRCLSASLHLEAPSHLRKARRMLDRWGRARFLDAAVARTVRYWTRRDMASSALRIVEDTDGGTERAREA